MKRCAWFVLASLVLVSGFSIAAPQGPALQNLSLVDARYPGVRSGQPAGWAMAQVDTVYLMGGPDRQDGKFQTSGGAVDPQGWSSHDLTVASDPPGVGDFAQVWHHLTDIDPCRSNLTPLWGFIDDGIVVPGTGGFLCTTWCYGPGGYIVNPEGGLAGPDAHLNNQIWSPVLSWPGDQYGGAAFEFDVYSHEPLNVTSPGMFYIWQVRSADIDSGEDIGTAEWKDRNQSYYSPDPVWMRVDRSGEQGDGGLVTDLLVPGRDEVQLALGVVELGWIWGFNGADGTPAPFFDNVAFLVWEFDGPGMSAREVDIAQDNFPAIGTIDYNNLAANSIRFDMASNIAQPGALQNDPGDSLIVDVVPIRSGSVLNDRPKMFYKLFHNPVFDPVRTWPLPAEGSVYGDTTRNNFGIVVPHRYNFDLPDTGFFFPGDVLHYYFEGQDNVAGDIGTTWLPGDTTGFSGPPRYPAYDSNFRMHSLPTLFSDSPDDHPRIMFWNDFADGGGQNEWYYALANTGYQVGVDYDLYYTNSPSSGVGNGLGGRGTSNQLSGYETILYTSGDLSLFTISNGDFNQDPSNDLGVLDSWLRQGGKNMFLTGDDLVSDLSENAGNAGQQFVDNWLSLSYVQDDLRPLIGNQTVPLVEPLADNSLNLTLTNWLAFGGCPLLNNFDAVQVVGDTELVAEFLDPSGSPGQYDYAAMTYHNDTVFNARIVYLPYDLMFVYTTDPNPGPLPISSRARLLNEVLLFFGHQGQSPVTSVPDADVFTVHNYPNPFNPSTKIEFFMPRRGELSIKIFNIRGELVRTLVDEVRDPGAGFVIWDGSDDRGSGVASGVYFYETRAMGETSVHKMALVK